MRLTSFGKRLRAERNRLQMSQLDFAERGGVKRSSQHLYESDARRPDADYLIRIHALGVDVTFLISGLETAVAPSGESVLTSAQALTAFRSVEKFSGENSATVTAEERERVFRFLCATLANPTPGNEVGSRLEVKWAS